MGLLNGQGISTLFDGQEVCWAYSRMEKGGTGYIFDKEGNSHWKVVDYGTEYQQ